MSDLNHEISQWITKAMGQFLPKPMPVDLASNNIYTDAADLLAEKARLLMEVHEARTFDGREPFTLDDYAAFQNAHKDLAEGHKDLAETLKAERPEALQAISAHGDAMALHNDAAKLAEMMQPSEDLGERNKMWPHMESNSFRFGRNAPWDTEEKQWRKAHQAFLASQLAAQKTAFDTGVVKKGGPENPELGTFRGDRYYGPRRELTPEMHERSGDRAMEVAKELQAGAQKARDAGDKEKAVRMHSDASRMLRRAVGSYQNAGHAEKEAAARAALGAHTVGDYPGHPFRGNQYTKSVDEVVEKGMNESLADILRHDQDHDDWHASHGDAPCTSEADCAAKRAKYAEVKAEEAANVSKGDTPGHPFRGNQYAQMAGQHMKTGADLREQAEAALSPENVAWDGEASAAQQRANIAAGNKIAKAGDAHLKAAEAMKAASENPTPANIKAAKTLSDKAEALSPTRLSHAQIADAHSDEARHLEEIARGHAAEGKYELATLAQNAADAHKAAAEAHDAVRDHSEYSDDRRAVRSAEYKTGDAGRTYDRAFKAAKDAETAWKGGATNKSAEIVQKGDVVGHVFHGNQYKGGTSSIPDNVGHRDFDPNTTLGQIGRMNILAVSGGKVHSIHDTDGKAIGVELPVSSGYKVRVFLRDDDTYTVQRVHRDSVKGEETGVYADEVGERVYQAGMYKSNPFGGHTPR